MRLLPAAILLLLAAAPAQACQSLPMIFFGFDSIAPTPHGVASLSGFAGQIQPDEVEQIRIVGHSDRTGSPASRERIALARAAYVRDALMALGLPARLLTAVGAADRQPLHATDDGVREPQNRRVELQVIWTEAANAGARARREAAIKAGEPVPMC